MNAARHAFERNGYFETRVEDIDSQAEVPRGTFYICFDSKQAIFRALVVEVGEKIHLISIPEFSKQERIRI